ncbi:MAG: DNA cytosine methyltransferase [Terriglobales bacterium]
MGEHLDQWEEGGDRLRVNTEEDVAADYGVSQNRKRVFLIGKRQDIAHFDGKTGRTAVHMRAVHGM